MQKHLRYLRYLLRHKYYVVVYGIMLGVPLWRLLMHDMSKFRPSEWVPYANTFYGTEADATKYKDAFDVAWLKHQHRNEHHWQHWILREDNNRTFNMFMPDVVAKEMVADWMAAGKCIKGGKPLEDWYRENEDVIRLHSNTRSFVACMICYAAFRLSRMEHDDQ